MGKSRLNRKGYTREQELVNENKALKREVSKYRKMLARLDLSRYENVKEAVEEHKQNNGGNSTQELLEALKCEWACKMPNCEGTLEVILFNKLDTTYYYRTCSHCSNRTKSQKYDSKSVRGIIKNK